jgi:hypothetical protein
MLQAGYGRFRREFSGFHGLQKFQQFFGFHRV